MDDVVFSILIFLIGFLFISFAFFKLFGYNEVVDFFKSLTPSYQKNLRKQYVEVLTSHSQFYNQLSEKGKERFIRKCSRFISTKRFIGMEGLEVTPEMKLRMAATAAQISFGMKNSAFSHYHTVKIFPESFYSRMHDNYLKGGTSISGIMYFSWIDFKEGFADPADRYNLGLHEMAHALRIQLKHGEEFDRRFSNYVDHWIELALPEFERMNEGKTSFLREYGGTNLEEFFAVCVEHFFEVPEEFKNQLPDIYNHLAFLLNIDPLNSKSDFILNQVFVETIIRDIKRKPSSILIGSGVKESASKPTTVNLVRNYKYATWHWSFSFAVAGLFLAFPLILFMYGLVLFEFYNMVLIIVYVSAIITTFKKYFHRKGIELFRHLMFFSIVGAGPITCAFVLVSNYFIKSKYESHAYQISAYEFRLDENSKGYWLVDLKNVKYDKFPDIRKLPEKMITPENYNNNLYLAITTSKGLWGFENFESKQVLSFSKPVTTSVSP